MAQHLGYANLNNGRALATLASLRYFGLLESTGEDQVALTPALAQYLLASEPARQALRRQWLRQPAVFASLLDQFPQELPSDSVLHLALIQRGFQPSSAQNCAAVLRQSVAFAEAIPPSSGQETPLPPPMLPVAPSPAETSSEASAAAPAAAISPFAIPAPDLSQAADCIPVRLSGGRKAWLLIPALFREADKARLKAQIDLLLTTEQDETPSP